MFRRAKLLALLFLPHTVAANASVCDDMRRTLYQGIEYLGAEYFAEDASRVLGFSSVVAGIIQMHTVRRNGEAAISRQGEAVYVSTPNGPVKLEVDTQIGRGYYGVVYTVKILEGAHLLPFKGELVVKFPIKLVSAQDEATAKANVRQEIAETAQVMAGFRSIGIRPIRGAEILAADTGENPYIVKTRVTGALTFEQVARQGMDQELALIQTQIFDKARRLFLEKQIQLDIRAENFYWDLNRKEWGLYEYSLFSHPTIVRYVRSGWNGYWHYLKSVIQTMRGAEAN